MDTTPPPLPTLRSLSEQVLRIYWSGVRDVGDCPYEVIQNLLKLSTAPQLEELERNSQHLIPYTDHIWKDLCIRDFIEVRILVEDGKLRDDDVESWRERYTVEEGKKEAKMAQVLNKLRGQYESIESSRASRQIQSIDGLRLEKRRKLMAGGTGGGWGGSGGSGSRPKSLFDKARSSTKAITSMYAPRKRQPQQRPAVIALPPSSRTLNNTTSSSYSPNAVKKPTSGVSSNRIQTSPPPRSATSSALSPPPAEPSRPSTKSTVPSILSSSGTAPTSISASSPRKHVLPSSHPPRPPPPPPLPAPSTQANVEKVSSEESKGDPMIGQKSPKKRPAVTIKTVTRTLKRPKLDPSIASTSPPPPNAPSSTTPSTSNQNLSSRSIALLPTNRTTTTTQTKPLNGTISTSTLSKPSVTSPPPPPPSLQPRSPSSNGQRVMAKGLFMPKKDRR